MTLVLVVFGIYSRARVRLGRVRGRARVRPGRVRGRARVRPGRVRVVVCGLFFLVVSMIVPAVVSWSSQ